MKYIMKVDKVEKTYGFSFNRITALQDISLAITPGEFVAIVGPSGSGKSTLLHVMGGLEKPDKGEVLLDGENIYNYYSNELTILRRRKIGIVFQFFNLIESINVYENIVLPIHLDGLEEDKAYIDELIKMLNLEDKRNNYVDELSGGQQQRVAIARALATKPQIILADEPTGNLDSKSTEEVKQVLKLVHQKYQQTVIIVTHAMELAGVADHIISLKDGRIEADSYVQE